MRFNTATSSWNTLAPMPTARSKAAGAVDASGRLYVIGGATGPATSCTSEVERYNVDTDTWETLAPLPVALSAAASVACNDGRIYVVDGVDSAGTTLNTTYQYTPATNTGRRSRR